MLRRAGALRFGVAAAVECMVIMITILIWVGYKSLRLQMLSIQDPHEFTFWKIITWSPALAVLFGISLGMVVFVILNARFGAFIGRRWGTQDPWGLWSGMIGVLGAAIGAAFPIAAWIHYFDSHYEYEQGDLWLIGPLFAGYLFIVGIPMGLLAGWLTRLKAQRILEDAQDSTDPNSET